jgi:CheY-like chemotaxis protein
MSTIIVVEEDRLMRALLVEWLSGGGYTVHALSRAEALRHGDADLLIVDVFMPRQDGCAKLRDLRAAHPQTPLIAISGQFKAGLTGHGTARELGVSHVIGKPFSREQLLRVVHDVIGETQD